ncbi:hypothetical protein A2188_02995 [Candidatus Woesebacteria bacterium RIFOXYA1_FULL_43_9]|uniref:PIN domain-containing protein n=1 Tax=Candidatus Woesebacteria bacterium RIFOXYA1_FULL_43_9 TaxID=1802534 RepID=A0A1F8CMZ1_9BACT|nr:MAG: hypothetical protein A2188_02995 [Candidatus Woesebacteria bacterium RIFOXYA1_FULL_43_9]
MPQKIVVDSSVIVKWLNTTGEQDVQQARKLLKDFEEEKVELFTPDLAKYEVGNALLFKKMDVIFVKIALDAFASIPLRFIPADKEDLKEICEIAKLQKTTFYDASFIQPAIKLKATLVTANPKHQKIKGVKVISLADYR